MYGSDLNENDNFNDRTLVIHYQLLHGGDLNENAYFNERKLVLIILHVGDLNENENFKDPRMLAFARQRNSQLQLLLLQTKR